MKQIDLDTLIKKIELKYTIRALKATEGNIEKASHLIGVNRTTLQMRLKRLNIEIDREMSKHSNSINVETKRQIIDTSKLTERELNAYKKFSQMTKQQKIEIVLPLNDRPLDEITFLKLEQRFNALIKGEYKDKLLKKLFV